MSDDLKKVYAFHIKYLSHISSTPTIEIPEKTKLFRSKLMSEEFQELLNAIQANEPIENIAKELADCYYVILGTVLAYGLQEVFSEIFDEVHKSNMSKDVIDTDGKAIKGKRYLPANIKGILNLLENDHS